MINPNANAPAYHGVAYGNLEMSNMNNLNIGSGGQADIFEWKDGQVLKLFKKLVSSLPGTDISDFHT